MPAVPCLCTGANEMKYYLPILSTLLFMASLQCRSLPSAPSKAVEAERQIFRANTETQAAREALEKAKRTGDVQAITKAADRAIEVAEANRDIVEEQAHTIQDLSGAEYVWAKWKWAILGSAGALIAAGMAFLGFKKFLA